MNIGQLDSRIKVYQDTLITSELNEEQPKPTLLKTIWANVQPRTGSLMTGRPADTMLSKTTHTITVRAETIADIETDCYFMWEDRNKRVHRFEIDYILPPNRTSVYATIYVQEVI